MEPTREDKPNWKGRMRSADWTICEDESLTVQSDHDRADIKKILRKYHEVGIVDELNQTEQLYLDCTKFTDFADVQREVARATQTFMALPPHVRRIFKNDVATWLDAAHDEEKRQALVEEGHIDDLEGTVEAPPEETPPEETEPTE